MNWSFHADQKKARAFQLANYTVSVNSVAELGVFNAKALSMQITLPEP
jgi:hypothetical protein